MSSEYVCHFGHLSEALLRFVGTPKPERVGNYTVNGFAANAVDRSAGRFLVIPVWLGVWVFNQVGEHCPNGLAHGHWNGLRSILKTLNDERGNLSASPDPTGIKIGVPRL